MTELEPMKAPEPITERVDVEGTRGHETILAETLADKAMNVLEAAIGKELESLTFEARCIFYTLIADKLSDRVGSVRMKMDIQYVDNHGPW